MAGVKQSSGKIISWTHADLQTDPQDIINAFEKFAIYAKNENYILKGKRIGRNYFDVFFTYGMSIIATYLLKYRLSDINAQPKMFYRSFLSKMKNSPDDFSLDLYLLYMAKLVHLNLP